MCIDDFVKPLDFERIKAKVLSREIFQYEKRVVSEGITTKVCLDGRIIEKRIADSVWRGNDYLIGFAEDRTGRGTYCGSRFATDAVEIFENYDAFKVWFDRSMKHVPGYTRERIGQVAWF